jgi:protein-disulfide isomerase
MNAHPIPVHHRRRACAAALLALLATLLLAITGTARAQIGSDPERLAALAGLDHEPLHDGSFVTAAGLVVEPVVRNAALYAVRGRGEPLDAAAVRELAALVGAATGFGAGIEPSVIEFLEGAVPELAGQGPAVVGIERFRLTLDVSGSAAPFDVAFGIALAELPEEAFPAARHAKGPADAAIVVREFSDFQCPACRRFNAEVMPRLEATVLDREDVRIEYHHFPLVMSHANAFRAAEAAECVTDVNADDPDAFWTYHDALYARQPEWAGVSQPDTLFVALAADAQLTSEGVAACLAEGRHRQTVEEAYGAALALQLRGTPTIFVGGYRLENFADVGAYQQAIAYLEAFGPAESDPDAVD